MKSPGERWLAVLCWCGWVAACTAQTLPLPPRPGSAPTGSEFLRDVSDVPFAEREAQIRAQILSGNVPSFHRKLCAVTVTATGPGRTNSATFYVTPEYLAIGSDADYFLVPMTPATAQQVADALGCGLPTRKMVDAIYAAAAVKLVPTPIPPSAAMTTVPVFSNHNSMVWTQRVEQLSAHPLGELVAGHKKDVVITPRLGAAPGKVAIYGWHKPGGSPIQPLYLGHTAAWVDYSQCIRLVQDRLTVNGQSNRVQAVLTTPALCELLSDEGVFVSTRYSTNPPTAGTNAPARAARSVAVKASGFSTHDNPVFGERNLSFKLDPDVRVTINSPASPTGRSPAPPWLILFTLPNGNTIEQTMGRELKPGDDWHFDIQQIAAQTRFLRRTLTNRTIAVAYLEAGQKSWPAWRKLHGDDLIPAVVEAVRRQTPGTPREIALTSHSGGGGFIFGYLNAVERIPAEIVRIAFLDSNYAYDAKLRHDRKLAAWLKGGEDRALCVLAYNDAVARLNGKAFVSEAGGTWGRTHAMLADWREIFGFHYRTNDGVEVASALEGRLQFLLKENPEGKIFHTVQVERNGFIHCVLAGTTFENQGYTYFGPRAYTQWIQRD